MRCIVTAGPTYEPLDEVRRLTNFSTGRLGTTLADFLAKKGHEVLLLRGTYATADRASEPVQVREFSSTVNLRKTFELLAKERWDAIYHAAAVGDFGFGKVFVRTLNGELMPIHDATTIGKEDPLQCRKLTTREGSLLVELLPTPKLLPLLRDLFPQALIVGWKFELDRSRDEAIARGKEQVRDARTNACVVNGAAYGQGFGLVQPETDCTHLEGLPELTEALEKLLSERPKING
jgi:phosphopantothenoylcysteine synthetase/decarboxylase